LSFVHFQALSNDLATPAVFVCPADPGRTPAGSFSAMNNRNVSYFVGANAEYFLPNSILAGDRNVMSAGQGSGDVIRIEDENPASWTRELHGFKGNQLFADGRVERVNVPQLRLLRRHTPAVMDLVLPSVRNPRAVPAALASVQPHSPADFVGKPRPTGEQDTRLP
jgi:prepilin-type processing-associated H-X9-DG protein